MIKGVFSKSGNFHASYIKNVGGRAEVQIHPINKNELDHSLALTFPVSSNSEVVHLEWINIGADISSENSSRKRKSDNSVQTNKADFVHLAVILKNGSIMLYSPFKKELVNEFQASNSVISCHFPSSRLRNAIWILYAHEIVLVELSQFKILDKISIVSKNLKNLTSLSELNFNGNDYLLIAYDEGLALLDIESKGVSNTIHLGSTADKIHSITIPKDNNHLIVAGSQTVYVVSLPEFKLVKTISYTTNILSLFSTKLASFGVILQDLKVEIVSNFLKKPTTKTISCENSLNGVVLNSLYQEQESQLFISVFDFELRLELVQARDLKKAKHVIDLSSETNSAQEGKDSNVNEQLKINAPRELASSEELYISSDTELIKSLESTTEEDSFKVLQVLVSNSDRIKAIVTRLSEDLAQKIFKIIAFRLELHSSESTSLNEWLKWLLLSHKTITTNPANKLNLKNLKRELSRSTKNLPTFLGLQGRLELLKSQLQLRKQISTSAEEEFSLLENKGTASQVEIVYVNGENDENDEEVIVGNEEDDANVEEALNNMDSEGDNSTDESDHDAEEDI